MCRICIFWWGVLLVSPPPQVESAEFAVGLSGFWLDFYLFRYLVGSPGTTTLVCFAKAVLEPLTTILQLVTDTASSLPPSWLLLGVPPATATRDFVPLVSLTTSRVGQWDPAAL